jgi:hypothetical protein
MIEAAFKIYKTNPIYLVLLQLGAQNGVRPSPDMGLYYQVNRSSFPH